MYDKKVHIAATTMAQKMRNDLSSMGIPFFAIHSSLIVDSTAGEEGRISKKELFALQQKMIEHLEDIFGPEEPS